MRSAWPIVAVLFFGSACATDEGDDTRTAISIDVPAIDETYAVDLADDDAPPDICGLLPPDGPCALACDEDALAEQYVPAGACAAFACTLTDGTEIAVHACHIGN
jgi:hypothetical protein